MTIPKSLCQGRYVVRSTLGQSEHSTVYECYDPKQEQRVAVKVLAVSGAQPDIAREMFRREVGALEGFEHPHLVQMHRYEEESEQGRLSIVLDLVEGGQTLESLINTLPPPPVTTSLRWKCQQLLGLLEVLDRAHQRGIIHRDVKLSNVLFDPLEQVLKLSDFGIARILENYGHAARAATLRSFYSRPYAAPEQVLGQDTSFPADLHAFGVVAASLFAWRIPPLDFTAEHLSDFLPAPSAPGLSPELHGKLLAHLRLLLQSPPASRPRVPEVQLLLGQVVDASIDRLPLRIRVTTAARRKAAEAGFVTFTAFLEDLNQGLRVLYEPEKEGATFSLLCVGRRGQARLKLDSAISTKLVVIDVFVPHGAAHSRKREEAEPAPFLLVEGDGSGQALIDVAWNAHQKSERSRTEKQERESRLALAKFILEKQRERLSTLRVRFRLPDEESEGEKAPAPQRERLVKVSTEHLHLKVLEVGSGPDPLGQEQASEGEQPLPPDWHDILDWNVSTFAFKDEDFGTMHGYDPETRMLTLRLKKAVRLPREGEITCSDVAQRTALDRQERAITTFLDEAGVNPRLGRLLLHPDQNTLDEREPVELIQQLEPADRIADIISRALSARDFFFVQGPPGTGKTALISEVMAQLLSRKPGSRILLSSQANEAVSNAVDALRRVAEAQDASWRIVRDVRSGAIEARAGEGFDQAFAEWARTTRERSAEAESRWLNDASSTPLGGCANPDRGKDTSGDQAAVETDAAVVLRLHHRNPRLDEADCRALHIWTWGAWTPERDVPCSGQDAFGAVFDLPRGWFEPGATMGFRFKQGAGVSGPWHEMDRSWTEGACGWECWIRADDAQCHRSACEAGWSGPEDEAQVQGSATGRQGGAPDEAARTAVSEALANWRDKLPYLPDVKTDYAESVQVWGVTLLRAPALWRRLRDVRFDYVIIDEAARATPAELLVALIIGKRFILVGDHKQLPPFLDSETIDDLREAQLDLDAARKPWVEELFEAALVANRETLRRQFRMHHSIGTLVGTLFYPEIGIENGVPDEARSLSLKRFGGSERVFWLDVREGRERQTRGRTSRWNHEEAVAIERLLVQMDEELQRSGDQYSVGIIAAYADQREKLRERIRPGGSRWRRLSLRIDTVDAFQGKQDDIIIYSMVRANTAETNFISDPRRLNVAFSRAKRLLVIVGHRDTATQSPRLAEALRLIPEANILEA